MTKRVLLSFAVALATATLLTGLPSAAQTEKILHNFNSIGNGGDLPNAGLVFDSLGNLYSTNESASLHNEGTVFELSPPATGTNWTEKVLHIMSAYPKDGTVTVAGVTLDSAGNLYGVSLAGGALGGGNVFGLIPKAGGGSTEKILHNFIQNGVDGTQPTASLIFDAAGNLYGTTYTGGPSVGGNAGFGTVYKLAPTASGEWTETILHQFANGNDGAYPSGNLLMDASGNLYGTTSGGGGYTACTFGCGTVFKLAPNSDGTWTETVLYAFTGGADGALPQAGLVIDSFGILYGTTLWGGIHCSICGTVFQLIPGSLGTWTEVVLHSFGGFAHEGINPAGSLVFDPAGNLYGTTVGGGFYGRGTAFELSPKLQGGWSGKILHNFGNGLDGQLPDSNLIFDSTGNLYGTTVRGGKFGVGTVFEITP